MLRRLLLALLLVGMLSVSASAREKRFGYCANQVTGARVTNCTVTVYVTGTLTLATLYQDNIGTPQSNPFTASAQTGLWFFYADNGHYDVQFSGGTPTISPAYTLSDYLFLDVVGAGIGGTVTATIFQSASPNPAQSGVIELSNTDLICWRNFANTADNCLGTNTSDQLNYNGHLFAFLDVNQTFTGLNTFSANATFTANLISSTIGPNSSQQHVLPAVTSDTIGLLTAAQTFTNKTYVAPAFSGNATGIANFPVTLFNSGVGASSSTFWRGDGTWAASGGGGGGSVTSVGLTLPPQLTVAGSPITGAGTLVGGWANQYPNTFLGGPAQNSLSGIFDGTITGSATAATFLQLSLTPTASTDLAFYLAESQHGISQPSAIAVTGGPGSWTSLLANGNTGALMYQLLPSAAQLIATANLTNTTTWTGALFFLTANGTPGVLQHRALSGSISSGSQIAFLSNTTIGSTILVTLDGVPPSSSNFTASIQDSQGNIYTPVAFSQNGSLEVVAGWAASNVIGATTDNIILTTFGGSVTGAALHIAELSNIAPVSQQPTFRPIQYRDVVPFIQSSTTTTTTCPTTNAGGALCTYTLTWPIQWLDNTYAVSCSGTGITNYPFIQGVDKTATTVTIHVTNGTANQAMVSGYASVDCIGVRSQ